MQKPDSKITEQINLIKLPNNTSFEFDLTEETEWLKDILTELNENAAEISPETLAQETWLSINGEIEKKDKQDMGEFLLAKGEITAFYATECIRTLKPMKVELSVPFKVCFLDEELGTSELFAETDETWVENDVYEIYYYNKRTVNFKEMLHEQVFLHYNQYPVLDAESKLEGLTQDSSKP